MAQQITQQQGHGLDEMLSQRPGVGGDLATPAVPPRTMPRTSSQTSNISGISAEVLRLATYSAVLKNVRRLQRRNAA